MEKVYACIDFKAFYASVEAVERGLNPLQCKLVVADASRGFRVIIMTEANSSVKSKVLKLLLKLKTEETDGLCVA